MASAFARRGVSRLSDLIKGVGLSSPAPPITARVSCQPSDLSSSEMVPFGVRMASTQIIRNRMRSVKSIQKITKAMKMVAASKLRGAQKRVEKSRGIWQPFVALLGDHPDIDVKKTLNLTVSSDRGLCGGINSSAVRYSKALFKLSSGPDKEALHIIIGEKGKAQLQRDSKKTIAMTITEGQKMPMSFTQVSMIADEILKNFEFDAIKIVFNKFNSVISFAPTVATVLSPEMLSKESDQGGKVSELASYEIEGAESKEEILQNLSEFNLVSVLFNACLENACSEQGARMSAMDSSTRNASQMLESLSLIYNRTRQASITTELIEIISGAAALEASA